MRADGVVPLRTDLMALQLQSVHDCVGDLDAGSILLGDEMRLGAQTGLRSCLTEVVESDFQTA